MFDIDETLIHCNENLKYPGDKLIRVQVSHYDIIKVSSKLYFY